MSRFYLSLVCLLGIMASANSQNTLEIRNNNLRAFLKSNGALLPDTGIHGFDFEQEGEFIPLIHYTGLWLGARDVNGNLLFAQTPQGGRPGPIVPTPGFNKAWQVNATEIAAHRADFEADGVVDNPIAEIYAWPGRGNTFFFDYNGFELPQGQDANLAPFWDVDGNGLYNPDQGDYPILGIRGCNIPIIPTQMNWTVFTVMENTGNPMDISLNVFYFSCEEMNPLNESIFTHYKIINWADFAPPLPETRWGLFTDADLGCPTDDYVGSFPDRNSAYFYNADNEDEDCLIVQGFGSNPPALGISLYRGPLGNMGQPVPLLGAIPFFNPNFGSFPPGATDPNTAPEYFNYLQGKWRDGSPLTLGGIGYGGSEPASFAFPGLPDEAGAWTEWEEGNGSGDRRVLMSYGSFEMAPGAVNEVIAGYTVHREGEDHLDQARGLRDQLDMLQAYFDNCLQVNTDIPELPPCTPVMTSAEDVRRDIVLDVTPNPAREVAFVRTDAVIKQIVLFDAMGRQVLSSAKASLNLGQLPPGLYFVHVCTNQGIAVEKLVVE
ncbi:MAG: T9SS type A sorting domain-containing protein [Phaeodactylibacter sp.]|nr:T9SS type A sorting domain-containing protein [Phaeodactylibacter sp.]